MKGFRKDIGAILQVIVSCVITSIALSKAFPQIGFNDLLKNCHAVHTRQALQRCNGTKSIAMNFQPLLI